MDHVAEESKAVGAAVVSDCGVIKGLTLGGAKKMGKLANGGSLLVVTGGGGPNGAACSTTHYDSSLECASTLAEQPTSDNEALFHGANWTIFGVWVLIWVQILRHFASCFGLIFLSNGCAGCWVKDKDHQVQINKMLKQVHFEPLFSFVSLVFGLIFGGKWLAAGWLYRHRLEQLYLLAGTGDLAGGSRLGSDLH